MTIVAITNLVDPTPVGELCDRAAALLASGYDELVCDVHAVDRPDASTVDALARIQLIAMRSGQEMWIRGASDQLRELIGFMGLRDVLRLEARW